MAASATRASDPDASKPAELAEVLGVEFVPELLEQALTHSSYAYEHGGVAAGVGDNERLEFIGDRILGQAVALWLYRELPEVDEGVLSKYTHALVSTVSLAEIARELGVGRYLRLGRGEVLTGGADKDSLLADAMEALFGAAFLSAGPAMAEAFVLRLITPKFPQVQRIGAALDPKTALQEAAAAAGGMSPVYVVEAAGPDHARSFVATVTVSAADGAKRADGADAADGALLSRGTGRGSSKKVAEMAAALAAWRKLTDSDRA